MSVLKDVLEVSVGGAVMAADPEADASIANHLAKDVAKDEEEAGETKAEQEEKEK